MYLFGGGLFQSNATVMLMAAESSDEHNRSRTMYYIYSSYLFTEFLAPAIASVAMHKSLWIAFGIGVAFLLLYFAVIPFIPKTYQQLSLASSPAEASPYYITMAPDSVQLPRLQKEMTASTNRLRLQ
jgi:MFS family permease